jgi:hypothetical protein
VRLPSAAFILIPALLLWACEDEALRPSATGPSITAGSQGSGASSASGPGGATGSGAAGSGGGLPSLAADLAGTFADDSLQLIIELGTRSVLNDAGDGQIEGDGVTVELEDKDNNSVAITNLVVTADGVAVPMTGTVGDWTSSGTVAEPIAVSYAFTIEAGAGNTLSNLVYDTTIVPPHSISTPTPNSTLVIGNDVMVQWSPNNPLLWFQVDFSNQPFDAVFAVGDPGTYTFDGANLTDAQPQDFLRVGRRAIQFIEGMTGSAVRHTHKSEIEVVVL